MPLDSPEAAPPVPVPPLASTAGSWLCKREKKRSDAGISERDKRPVWKSALLVSRVRAEGSRRRLFKEEVCSARRTPPLWS